MTDWERRVTDEFIQSLLDGGQSSVERSRCSPVWIFECPICWQKIPESDTTRHLEKHCLALSEAEKLIDEIMRGRCNAEDECEKWLREFCPGYLA